MLFGATHVELWTVERRQDLTGINHLACLNDIERVDPPFDAGRDVLDLALVELDVADGRDFFAQRFIV